jgi:O-antigen ligase
VDLWLERGILALVLVIVVFGPLAFGAVDTLPFLVIQGLTLGVMALWGARLVVQPSPNLLWPPISWAVAAFVLYAVGRYLTADLEFVARRELLRVLVYGFLFLAVLNNLHRQEHVRSIAFTLIGLGVLEASYALFQFLTHTNRVWTLVNPYVDRGSGTYICPNHLAGLLEMILPLSLSYMLVGRLKPVPKIFLGYAGLMILAGIAVTVSRASWLATGAALAVLCLVLLRYSSFRVQTLLLLVVVVAGAAYGISRSERALGRLQRGSLPAIAVQDMRLTLWQSAWQMWHTRPWFGVGPGHFDYRFREYRPPGIQHRPDRVHNDYLNTLTDWGVVGTGIVAAGLAALALSVFQIWSHVRRGKKEFSNPLTNKFAFVLGAAIGLLALALHSFLDFNMQLPANAILAIVLAALLSSYYRFATERFWLHVGPARRVLTLAILAGGLAWMGWQEVVRARQYVWLRGAQSAPRLSLQRVACLEQAFAADPKDFELAYEIGEAYRLWSWDGYGDPDLMAAKAIDWYARALQLNPYDAYSHLRTGMCLDLLGQFAKAEPSFRQAEALDPAGYFTLAHIGWHFVQTGDYAAARPWLERSLHLQPRSNDVATAYLKITQEKLAERARSR